MVLKFAHVCRVATKTMLLGDEDEWLLRRTRLPLDFCSLPFIRRHRFLRQALLQYPSPVTEQWARLILSYARHRKIFLLRVEDAETKGSEFDEILRNERINRRLLPSHLSYILSQMVAKDQATYEPVRQTRSILLYWRLPEEWAEVLHEWATSTGQLNTILTFYEITEPPIESPLSGIPVSLLRKAITILNKTGRAQIIGVADGEGVRLFAGTGK